MTPCQTPLGRPGAPIGRPCRPTLLASLLLLLAGCSPAPTAPIVDDDPGLPPTPTYTPTEAAFAANINPLSGLPSETRDIAARRPEVVALAPTRGTDEALLAGLRTVELVFVSLLSADVASIDLGGIRHVTALTLEPPERRPALDPLGPATALDAAVALGFHAGVTAASASDDIAADLRASALPLTLDSTSGAEAQPDAARIELPPPPRWGYSEHPLGPIDRPAETAQVSVGDEDKRFHLPISLDRALGVWRLGRARATGEDPLAIANVLILTLPNADPEAADLGWRGEGPAMLLRDGVAQSGRWSRPDPRQPFGLVSGEGLAMALRPGNTWVLLAPGDADIAISGGP